MIEIAWNTQGIQERKPGRARQVDVLVIPGLTRVGPWAMALHPLDREPYLTATDSGLARAAFGTPEPTCDQRESQFLLTRYKSEYTATTHIHWC